MKHLLTIALAIALFAIAAPTAGAASKGFKTGTYEATGPYSFTFTVSKNTCISSSNKKQRGYCFRAYGKPDVPMICPAGEGFQPNYTGFVSTPFNELLPKSGRFRSDISTFFTNGEVAGTTYFNMKLSKNGRASGALSLTEKTIRGAPGECTSGNLAFSAKRTSSKTTAPRR